MINIFTLAVAYFAGICTGAVLFIILGYIFVKKGLAPNIKP